MKEEKKKNNGKEENGSRGKKTNLPLEVKKKHRSKRAQGETCGKRSSEKKGKGKKDTKATRHLE